MLGNPYRRRNKRKKVDESGEPRSGEFLTENPDDIPF
jgi:hypothetical protein